MSDAWSPGKPDYTALDLPAPPPDRPYVIANTVMSADGKSVIEGTEQGLGSAVDQRLMRELRVNADVVLNGAGTLRASGTSSRLGDEALEAIRLEQREAAGTRRRGHEPRGRPAPGATVLHGAGLSRGRLPVRGRPRGAARGDRRPPVVPS